MSEKKSRAGRPTVEQSLRRALEPFKANGFNNSLCSPLDVIAMLAVDPAIAPETRLAAAIALHDRRGGAGNAGADTRRVSENATPSDSAPPDDEISRRTMEILKRGTSR